MLRRRIIWAWVAAEEAWRRFPRPTTVLPNDELANLIRDAGYTGPLPFNELVRGDTEEYEEMLRQ